MTNLPPNVSPADDHFWLDDDPPDILYCEDPECGYSVDAFEVRYTDDPICPDCACPLTYERPEAYVIAYRDPLSETLRRADAEPSYPTRGAAQRRLDAGRDLRFLDHPDIGLSYRVADIRELGR